MTRAHLGMPRVAVIAAPLLIVQQFAASTRLAKPPKMKTCSGSARVLQGNARLIGDTGGFGRPVTAGGAAVVPTQWGGKRALRPHLDSLSGTFPGKSASFHGIDDVVGGRSPIKGMNVRDALQKLYPGKLIIELPGAPRDYGTIRIRLACPVTRACPAGTKG